MKKVLIEEIRIADELLVRPKLGPNETFEFIYRSGSGVTWKTPYLCAREPAKWEHIKLLKQIVIAILGEYGQQLVIGPETRWIAIPKDLRDAMVTAVETLEATLD